MKNYKLKETYPQNLLEETYADKFSEQEISNISAENVENVIKLLNEKYSKIVILRYKQLLTLKQISEIYEVTQPVISDILVKIKRILRQEKYILLITGMKINENDFSENDDISFLKLNCKTCSCLKLYGHINTISNLMELSKNQLLGISGIGENRANEIIKSISIFKRNHDI